MIDLLRDVFVAALLVSVMLSVGFDLELKQLRAVFRRPVLLLGALSFEHVAMPLLAFGIATAVGGSHAAMVAVVLCACAPGGPMSLVFVHQARGAVPLAVSMVVMMACLNVIGTPLTLSLFGFASEIEGGVAGTLIRMIALYQLLPLALSMAWRVRHPVSARRLAHWSGQATKVIIALLIVGLTIARWDLLWSMSRHTLVTLVATCLVSVVGGYLVGFAAGVPARRALAMVAGTRNLSLALLVASSAFSDEVTLAVMVYGMLMMVVAAPFAIVWSRRAPLDVSPA